MAWFLMCSIVSIPTKKMKDHFAIIILFFLLASCIPLRIAPEIEDYRITKGHSFKKELPNRIMFVFEDPKDAGQFYNYINVTFQLNNENVYDDVPFTIENQQFFFSFYEVEIPDKSINLIPVLFDVLVNEAVGNEETDPILSDEDAGYSRVGHWYIAIEVYSDLEEDCLQMNSLSREVVLDYLRFLKKEYLSTHNYNEVVFKN